MADKEYPKPGDAGFLRAVIIDECPDADGNWTMRFADGTPNGDIHQEPLGTFYREDVAEFVARTINDMGKLIQLNAEKVDN